MPGKQQHKSKGRQQRRSSPDCQQCGALVLRGQGKGLVRSKGLLHQMDEIYMMRDGVLERQE